MSMLVNLLGRNRGWALVCQAVASVCALIALMIAHPQSAQARIHSAPIVTQGFKIRYATGYPIATYRVFATGPKGEALPIPFQIDELNDIGDYVLDQGSDVTKKDGNGIFNLQDELVIMGDDVGPATPPRIWNVPKPPLLYEMRLRFRGESPNKINEGAVYIGIYFKNPPPQATKKYVVFDKDTGIVKTSRYVYKFDKQNYLVVNGIDMYGRGKPANDPNSLVPLINSSTFYMRADLKYFLTFEVNHRDINSYLEAFKVGPIRTIVRVTFFYRVLKMNFELGMYTEVSLFSNAVLLPAVMFNPLDGQKSLNDGSTFYYGFAVSENPKSFDIKTNLPTYEKAQPKLLNLFKKDPPILDSYWLSLTSPDRMMYFEVNPSKEMLAKKNVPYLYREDVSAEQMKNRPNTMGLPLGKSPVNMGISFDLSKFSEGEHRIAFKLFFDNYYDPSELETYKQLDNWQITLQPI